MKKIENLLSKILLPISEKLQKQKHLQSIKDGMIQSLPIIIVGSLALLPIAFMNLIPFQGFKDFIESLMPFFNLIALFTTDMMALYVVFYISKNLRSIYKMDNSMIEISAVIVFFIFSSLRLEGGITTEFLGPSGMFVAIFISIFTVEFWRLLFKYNVQIKFPSSIPPMVGKSFSAILPLFIITIVSAFISVNIARIFGTTLPQIIMNVLAPAVTSMDSIGAIVIVVFLTQLFWFFGLHGPSITMVVWAPFAISYGAENISNFQNGLEVTHMFTYGLYYNILQVTGSGLTLGLVILMLLSKNQELKIVGKTSIIPALFGINEPVIFGVPMILNPIMFLPFVIGPTLVSFFTALFFKIGWIGLPIADPLGFMPPGVGAFLLTADWRAVIWVFISLIIMTIIYYPFFKVLEKQNNENIKI